MQPPEITTDSIYEEMRFLASMVETKHSSLYQDAQFHVSESAWVKLTCHVELRTPDEKSKPDDPLGYLFSIPIFVLPDTEMSDTPVRIVNPSHEDTA